MDAGNRAWSSKDSRHCWDALFAMWSAKVFKDCLRKNTEVVNEESNSEFDVETVVLRWNGTTGEFSQVSDLEEVEVSGRQLVRPPDNRWCRVAGYEAVMSNVPVRIPCVATAEGWEEVVRQ